MADRISTFSGTRFMSHEDDPCSFGIRFRVADDKSVYARVVFDETKQGGMGILHGGAIAAVLDEAMGVAAFEYGHAGYTVTMTYNYKAHIPLGEEVLIRAWVEKMEGRKVFAACETRLANGKIAVNGTGIFVKSEKLQKELYENPYYPNLEP